MSNLYPIEQQVRSTGFRDLLVLLFKRKAIILTVFLTVSIGLTVVALLMPSVYVAKSSVLVKIGREYLNNPEVGDEKKMMAVNMTDILKTEIQILTNRELAENVVKSLQIERLYPKLVNSENSLQKAVARFQKDLSVEGVKNSSVIQVNFRHSDPKIAANAVNLLIDMYKEKHLQVFSSPRSSFLDQQLTTYEQQLKESEKKFEEFKQKNQVYSLEEQRSLLLQQRVMLDTALKDAQNRVDELSKKLITLTKQNQYVAQDKSLNIQQGDTESDRIVGATKSKLLALQLEEQQLLKKYNENSRMVANARKEIDIVQTFLKNQENELQNKQDKPSNVVVQQVRMDLMKTEAELNSQKARIGAVRAQLGQVDSQIQALDRNGLQFQNLKREVAATEKNYLTYMNKAEEARLSEDMNRLKLANISVIQPAVAPSVPTSNHTLVLIIIGCLGGFALGLGIAFLIENLYQNLSTPEQTEKYLGLPVLASLPYRE